jgi:hypothetical protein
MVNLVLFVYKKIAKKLGVLVNIIALRKCLCNIKRLGYSYYPSIKFCRQKFVKN